jgi:predicted nucleotidyltransferase
MLEILFSSRVRAKILSELFQSPGEPRNAHELAQSMGEHYSAVWKELVKLEKIGILSSRPHGNSKEYQINPQCPIVNELRSIVIKTEGVGKVIKSTLKELNTVQEAFIFGSYASGEADERSDIDLMIIGDVDLEKLSPTISKLEKEINRPINYVIYSNEDWNNKEKEKDSFWVNVNESPKINIIGSTNAV